MQTISSSKDSIRHEFIITHILLNAFFPYSEEAIQAFSNIEQKARMSWTDVKRGKSEKEVIALFVIKTLHYKHIIIKCRYKNVLLSKNRNHWLIQNTIKKTECRIPIHLNTTSVLAWKHYLKVINGIHSSVKNDTFSLFFGQLSWFLSHYP